jgi:hypothetical protein
MKLKTTTSTALSKKAQRLLSAMPGDGGPRARTGPHIAAPRRVVTTGRYDGSELAPAVGINPTRMSAYHLPSRIGDTLRWPDGRVTGLDGMEVA